MRHRADTVGLRNVHGLHAGQRHSHYGYSTPDSSRFSIPSTRTTYSRTWKYALGKSGLSSTDFREREYAPAIGTAADSMMHPGIFNGPKSTRVTSDASSVERPHREHTRVLRQYSRTWNWNSAWATTDDVYRERKYTRTHENANWETACGSHNCGCVSGVQGPSANCNIKAKSNLLKRYILCKVESET